MSNEVSILDSRQAIHSNSTITSSGSTVLSGYGGKEVNLIVNITASPTGSSPTLQFTITEIDPGDLITTVGSTVTGASLNSITTQVLTLPATKSGTIKISWVIGGGTPSFTGVYVSLSGKTASTAIMYDAAGNAIGTATNPFRIDPVGTTTQTISGTVTSNQGTANTLANAWSTKITDATNGPVAVKAASTAPVVGDQALVVVLSPNQPAIPVTTNAPNSTPDLAKGYVATSATTTVPVRATTYTEQSSNFTGSIASANANDTSAGTGARTVRIYYVDATGATAGTEDATLNGTTGVNLVTSTKCFIEKIVVLTVGTGGSNAGIISLYTGANKTGTVVTTIVANDNQTFLCHHYVVSGKTCNITGMTGFNNNTSNQTVFTIQGVSIPVANKANVQISDWITGGLTFQVVRIYDQLIKVPGPAHIQMLAAPGGTANIISRGSFDFYDA